MTQEPIAIKKDWTNAAWGCVWPLDTLAVEIDAAVKLAGDDHHVRLDSLFEDAFPSGHPSSLLRAAFEQAPRSQHPELGKYGWIELAAEVLAAAQNNLLRPPAPARPRYLSRSGANTPAAAPHWRIALAQVLGAMDSQGYFARNWFSCVDRPEDPSLFDLFKREYGEVRGMLPFEQLWRNVPHRTSDEVVFDMIELLHDECARPRTRWEHGFGGCGWHWDDFVSTTGQAIFRYRINAVLEVSPHQLKLAADGTDVGRLITTIDSTTGELEAAARGLPSNDDNERVDAAIKTFRERDATRAKKRQALAALAGVLEEHRRLIKDELGKNEGDLFNIANNFDVRHHNSQQTKDYGDEFMQWLYRAYLATIELVKSVLGRSAVTVAGNAH